MIKNVEIDDEKIRTYIQELYSYFADGYEFENFLKSYLEKLGLDEVTVTKKSCDGGFDLTAVRPGIGGFSNADSISYYVQAKRYVPNGKKIPVSMIRELKGIIPYGHKGIFITTAEFSNDAKEEAINDSTRPIVLIDGKRLIESCIDNELAFIFIPVFSKKAMDEIMNKKEASIIPASDEIVEVEKLISKNDIRARIIRIPNAILEKIDRNVKEIKVKLGDYESHKYKYNMNGSFISGVTEFLKDGNFIDENGAYNPGKVLWQIIDGKILVKVVE